MAIRYRVITLYLVACLGFAHECQVYAADSVSAEAVREIEQRYRNWVLAGPGVDYTRPHVAERYELLKRHARRTIERLKREIDFERAAPLYDTRSTGADQNEVDLLIKYVLPHLALAYQLEGPQRDPNPYFHDSSTLSLLMAAFDRLDERGFRAGMLMPWKSRQVQGDVDDRAVIVEFHLRTSGYALAAFLMRDQLQSSERLQRTLETCREVLSHGEKFGDPNGLKQNADGIRMAINFALPYALAARDGERLKLLTRQIDRSMAMESNAADTIKPDGLGFHHRGVYLSGYSAFAVAQSAFASWLFKGTDLACSQQMIANVSNSLAVLRIVSNKHDMHKSLSGRLREIQVIPNVMLGYSCLADLEHPRRTEFAGMLARLADDAFINGPGATKAFSPQRNEVPPGPGAIDLFFQTLAKARQFGAEEPPQGHWALNYGPLEYSSS